MSTTTNARTAVTPQKLHDLHAASLRLLGLLTVHGVEAELLQKGIESLTELIGARYGAIGILDEVGKLKQFVHAGIAPDEAARIGRLPEGRGLLGDVIHENHVLRLDDMTRDPRSVGFPPHHPPMKSLLAAPVSHDGTVYGRVYLSDKADGTPFTEEDEELVTCFADALALTLHFHRAEVERLRVQSTLRNVAHAVSTVTGQEFFRTLVLDLAKALNLDFALVGEMAPGRLDAVQTIAVCAKGRLVDNFTYELRGTPCINVVGKVPCHYPRNIQQQFPDDHMLRDLGIDSYVGHPLSDAAGRLLGLLVVMDSKPMRDPRTVEAVLQICAARSVAEIERRHAEEALRASEEDLRALAENANDGILVNSSGKHVFANRWLADLLGYTPEELRHTNMKDLVHPDEYDKVAERFRARLTGKTAPSQYETVFVTKNGAAIPVELNAARTVWQGQPAGLVFVRDIRARKQAEAEMHKLASAVEQTADSVLITDAEGVIQYVNPGYEKTTGYTRAEAVGRKPNLVKSGQHDAAFYQRLWATVRRGEVFRDVLVNRRKNGELYYEEKTITPLKNERGEITHFVSTGKDITERKRAEEALARVGTEWTHSMDFTEGALYLVGLDDKLIRANQVFYQLSGLTPEQAIGHDITALMHPQGETSPCPVCLARRARRDATITMEADDPNNRTEKPIEVSVRIVRDQNDRPASVLMGVRDLSRSRQIEDELRRSRAGLLEAQRLAHLGNWDWNVVTNELVWSEEVYRIFGVDPRHYAPSADGFLEAVHPEDREFVQQAAERALHERQKFSLDFRIQRPDGGLRIVHEDAEVLYDPAGKPLRLIGTVQDITERRQAEERLSYLAHYDVLTGMPNRALLLDRLRQSILDADRVERIVAVMFLDLDRFKVINDTLGHHVGDGLLKAVAERLKACLRPGDTIARIGGDEFTIVLANVAHVNDVARVARKILESFVLPFGVNGHELFTTTSIGITLYPFDVHDAEGLLKNADAAMYHAKELGRNTLQFFTAELNQRAERRLALETGLRQALKKNQLSLHYQPQVDLKSGRITGMEALARWKHPQLGDVPPVEFIPVAEETGLILPIGDWVLREACRQTKAWHDTGFPPMQIAVNLSGKQLLQKDFTDQVRAILRETNLAARYLDLELTESLLMADAEAILDIMHVLHDMGISFSVDDFGTGYSSLAYLKRFPIDILKIDRSFVRDLATDPNDVAIVKTIIAMAHTLGMRVVAEGVETRDQLEFLRGQGCDGSQGYYCSAPLSAAEFSELLTDWHQIRRGKCDFRPPATKKRKARQTPRATARSARGPARRIKK